MLIFFHQESYNCLLQEQQWLEDYANSPVVVVVASTDATTSTSVLPPPVLLVAMETRIELAPPSSTLAFQEVAYYKLYSRAASGSNIKVRETDKSFPGLGIEVDS